MGKIVGTPKLARDRKRPRDGNFYTYWTDSERGSCEKSTKTDNYDLAKKEHDRWYLLNRGQRLALPAEEVTVNDVLEHYSLIQGPKVSAPDRIKYAASALLSYWGEKPISTINRYSCAEYEVFRRTQHQKRWPRRKPLSANTIRREFGTLAAALHMAHADAIVDREITVFRPEEIHSEVEYFRCDEAIELIRLAWRIRRARHHLRLFLLIGFLTGRRKEAILSLRWSDIDFQSGIVQWNPEGRRITNKRRPVGKLPKRLRKHLIRHRRKFPDDEFVISYQGQGVADIKTAFAAVVRLYRAEKRKKFITEGMSASEAMRLKILPKAHPHMMRHSCATWLMQKGEKIPDSCSFLGMSEETLRRHYWHHHPDYQQGPADAF